MPIQSAESSACPEVCWVAVGTVQFPVIEVNSFPPCSTAPCEPNQLLLVLVLKPRARRIPAWLARFSRELPGFA
jgi:hypothetical protein